MPLKKLIFKPGVNRDQTNYANEGGWYACDKIRFLSGYPQKLGGWVKHTVSAYNGVCRALFTWAGTTSSGTITYNVMAVGTNTKIYIDSGGTLNDITPLRITYTHSTVPTTDNCISTASGSKLVTVTITAHGASAGDFVTLSGVVGPIGGVPQADFNKEFQIVTVPTANTFTITVATTATSTVSGSGGTAITAAFQIPVGPATTTVGYGWGVSPWGGPPGWGLAATTPLSTFTRLIYFDKRFSDLVFNIRYDSIYYWEFDPSYTTRAVLLSSKVGATDVPTKVTQVMFDDTSNILLAFGCTAYSTGNYDPLLIRWASQDNYLNWTPSDDPGISTAGYIRIQSGSAIQQAVSNYGETLVFTESSITSMQYTGAPDSIFAQKLISSDISLMGPRCVIAINNVLYWMGTDRFFTYTGRVEALPCTLRQHVFENINLMQADQFFAASNERFNEVWWFYCSANSTTIDKYIIYNYLENIWYYGSCDNGLTRTAWIDSPLRTYPQAASADDNYIYNQEQGIDAGESPMVSYILASDIDLPENDGDHFMLVRRIIPDVSFTSSTATNPTLDMTLYPRNFPGSAVMTTNQEGQDFDRPVVAVTSSIDQYTEQVFVRARARQIGFQISSSDLGVNWQLGAPRIDIRPDGLRG